MMPTLSLEAFRLDSSPDESVSVIQATGDSERRVAEEPTRKRKILIVQGDWESGMSLLGQDLKDAGHEVGKVFFCFPDMTYKVRGVRTHLFRKPLAEFDVWL